MVTQSLPILSEGSFTTYTKITDVVLDIDDSVIGPVNIQNIFIDEQNGWVYSDDEGFRVNAAKIDGSSNSDLLTGNSPNTANDRDGPASILNQYIVYQDFSAYLTLFVFSNGTLLATLDLSTFFNVSPSPPPVYAISKSGKYIAIIGSDITNTLRRHLVVFQGS